MESFVPTSVAVAEPTPAISARVFASTGTGDNRALYVSCACAASGRTQTIASPKHALMMGQYTTLAAAVVLRYSMHARGETMEIDRRAFIAGLGGVAAVAAMADEAKAEALEHHMMLQLSVANQAAAGSEKKFPTAAEVEAQIETQPMRRGTGNLFVSR